MRAILPKIPLDRLLIETDAPYMGFKGCRKPGGYKKPGKKYPNVPAALPIVAATVAECYGISAAELAATTTANARAFFGIPVEGE